MLSSHYTPTHTTSFHAIFDYVTTGTFNKARRNGIAFGKVLIVFHFVGIAFEERTDKMFIGRIGRGFVFLGYQMNAAGLVGIAPPTIKRFVERIHQLYEQDVLKHIGQYVRRWLIWVRSGLDGVNPAYAGFSFQLAPASLNSRE